MLLLLLQCMFVVSYAASATDLHGVVFADTSNGYAVGTSAGSGVVFKTTDGGVSWSNVYRTNLSLYRVYSSNTLDGWAVGSGGTIVYTRDGGENWISLNTGTTEDLFAITQAGSSGPLFAVGKNTTLLRSEDNGRTWIQSRLPTTAAVDLTNVSVSPSGMIVVLGRDRLFTSTDGGSTWSMRGPYQWHTLFALAFVDDNEGFLSDGALLHTTDGGKSLHPISLPENKRVIQIRAVGSRTLFVVIGSAATGSIAHLAGEKLPSQSTIFRSSDLGKTWQSVLHLSDDQTHKAFLADLYFIDKHGWGVGAQGTVVRTGDGGNSWQRSQVLGKHD